jgi:putative membrane protein insertion efficiency factor
MTDQQLVEEQPAEEPGAKPRGPIAKVLLVVLRGYRNWISPLTPPSCRFFPSCSEYAMDAVTEYGALRGSWMAVRRLLRCGPWHPGGVDPVPPRRVNTAGNPEQNAAEDDVHRERVPHIPAEE